MFTSQIFFLCACSMQSYFDLELKNNNTTFKVSETQTTDNGLSQSHFQGFSSPQQELILKKTQH